MPQLALVVEPATAKRDGAKSLLDETQQVPCAFVLDWDSDLVGFSVVFVLRDEGKMAAVALGQAPHVPLSSGAESLNGVQLALLHFSVVLAGHNGHSLARVDLPRPDGVAIEVLDALDIVSAAAVRALVALHDFHESELDSDFLQKVSDKESEAEIYSDGSSIAIRSDLASKNYLDYGDFGVMLDSLMEKKDSVCYLNEK